MRSDQEEHPSLFRLKAHLGGETDPVVALHLSTCAECAASVEHLERQRQEFLARGPAPEAFADQVMRRAQKGDQAPAPRGRRSGMGRWAWAGVAAAASVLVALAMVWQHPGRPGPGVVPGSGFEPGAGSRTRGAGLQLKLVRIRKGRTSRHVEPSSVAVGDEINVELSLSGPMRVSAGLLGDDGAWLPLFEARKLGPGVHHGDRALTVEGEPGAGWLLAGPADLVRKAVARRRPDAAGITAVRVLPAK